MAKGNKTTRKEKLNFSKISNAEMEKLIKGLPDWAKEKRKEISKRYKGYKYHVDGIRIDESFYTMKTDGKFQWMLYYVIYRDCGKGKRTRVKSELLSAACFDATGRRGLWVNYRFDNLRVAYFCRMTYNATPSQSDLLERFKYIDFLKVVNNGWNSRSHSVEQNCVRFAKLYYKEDLHLRIPETEKSTVVIFANNARWNRFMKYIEMYLKYPAIEKIYRIDNNYIRNNLTSRLYSVYVNGKKSDFKEYLAACLIAMRHKNPMFSDYGHGNLQLWWDCILGLRDLGKDIRNPHYIDIREEDLLKIHDEIMRKLERKSNVIVSDAEKKRFQHLNGRFTGMGFTDGDLEVKTLDSPEEYIIESERMHNCIRALKYYLRPGSLILVARQNGDRLADIEFSLTDYRIIQCCGPFNMQVAERERIEKLIFANLEEIKRRQAS